MSNTTVCAPFVGLAAMIACAPDAADHPFEILRLEPGTDAKSVYRVVADGNVWAELYNTPSDSTPKWMVLDAGGRWLGTVTMPRRFSPHDVGSDYVLGVWRDPDDVEHVRLYELLKPERDPNLPPDMKNG